ncbi:MAG: hypothetical protein A2X59_00080 [Nitrospirae bacterium GWC2_42_7]|nr:MAG: hypothetical protein A2X59_00080 [Nitrospirae bacterium GWC2_42_7]
MDIKILVELLNSFIKKNNDLIGSILTRKSQQKIDLSIFPDELDKDKLEGIKSGLYIFEEKDSGIVLYIGESIDITGRIYQHIGKGFTWGRNGVDCHFPHFGLTQWEGHSEYKDIFEKGNIYVTVIEVCPTNARNLLESFLIYAGDYRKDKPPLNINF